MKSLRLLKYAAKPILADAPRPIPGPQQVLIRLKYAPINPADIYYTLGVYGVKNPLPTPLGMEGSGIVVEGPNSLVGKSVAFLPHSSFGSWAEYALCNFEDCYEVSDTLQGCMGYINPFTALGFRSLMRNFKTCLFSSSRSAVAIMGVKLLQQTNLVFAISQKQEDWVQTILEDRLLAEIPKSIKEPCVFFDSHGGELAGDIFNLLPEGSLLVNYGCSSRKNIGKINPNHLIFKKKHIMGFWMHDYYHGLPASVRASEVGEIKSNPQIFGSQVFRVLPFDTPMEEIYRVQSESRGSGKVILQFH